MRGQAIYMKPAEGSCEIHKWPTEGLPRRLVQAMKERHGKGGINACVECIHRAKAEADRERAASPSGEIK